jgi:hypothetical protein
MSSCHGRAMQVMFGGVGLAWQRDVGACEKHFTHADPCMDAGKRTAVMGVRPNVRALALPISYPEVFFLLSCICRALAR